jgi:hypothetical protein
LTSCLGHGQRVASAQDVASIEIEPDRTLYCCTRCVHFTLTYRQRKAAMLDARASVGR